MATAVKIIVMVLAVACVLSQSPVAASCCAGVKGRLQPMLTQLKQQQHQLMAEAINALQTIKSGLGMFAYMGIIIIRLPDDSYKALYFTAVLCFFMSHRMPYLPDREAPNPASVKIIYTVSKKKRDQNVFCNISYKTRAIVMKFGTQFSE